DYEDKKKELIEKGYKFRFPNNDAEFVLNCYEEHGEKFIRELNGNFSFAILDKDELILVNDRYGFRPVYYYKDEGKLLFASEVKAIIKDKSVKRRIDWDAWADFFSYGWINGDKTFFKDIKTMPPGSVLRFKIGKMKIRKYWDYSDVKIDDKNPEEYFIQKGADLIDNAIAKRMKEFKKLVCCLSGGYDSRCIAAIIKKHKKRLRTYTTVTNYPTLVDQLLAKEIARTIKSKHKFVKQPRDIYKRNYLRWFYLTDGLVDEHMWMFPLIDIFDNSLMNFDGIAGDVLLRARFTIENYDEISNKNNEKLAKILNEFTKNEGMGYRKAVNRVFNKKYGKIINGKMFKSMEEELGKIKNSKNKIGITFLKNRTRKEVAAAANVLTLTKTESLLPFMDNELLEFSLSIPLELKVENKVYTKMISRINPRVMKIASTNDEDIKKTRYNVERTPMNGLKETREYLVSLLKKLEIPREIVNYEEVDEKLKEYIRNDENPIWFLFPCAHFVTWYNMFYKVGK
ncbi:asparagine synthetase B, partial [Candidatus Woesearchaeota archaeon]|nr:asparagine synthetase B [Candidatus Woesearchaeota archaeon]